MSTLDSIRAELAQVRREAVRTAGPALVTLRGGYPALASYRDLGDVARRMMRDRAALDSLALAYRSERGSLREGAFLLLVVALGDGLTSLAPLARDGGEVLEALWLAVRTEGAPALRAVACDLKNLRIKDARAARKIDDAHAAGVLRTATPPGTLARLELLETLRLLPPAHRELAALVALGFSTAEIDRITGRRAGGAAVVIHRLRRETLEAVK